MLAFTPKIDGVAITEYKTGDTITLKKGLCFYKWFGETDGTNTPKGDGDFVKVGEIKYDVVIRYNAQGKFAWNIAPADGRVLEEIVEVGLAKRTPPTWKRSLLTPPTANGSLPKKTTRSRKSTPTG